MTSQFDKQISAYKQMLFEAEPIFPLLKRERFVNPDEMGEDYIPAPNYLNNFKQTSVDQLIKNEEDKRKKLNIEQEAANIQIEGPYDVGEWKDFFKITLHYNDEKEETYHFSHARKSYEYLHKWIPKDKTGKHPDNFNSSFDSFHSFLVYYIQQHGKKMS